jgi:hypothetical protein
MPRFFSWIAVGIAAGFLVVVGASFPLSTVMWLTFAISVGTLVVSVALAVGYYRDIPTLVTALVTAVVSAWTIVASLVFSLQTVEELGLAAGIAIAALAIVGVTAHEVENELALSRSRIETTEGEAKLAAAA